MAGTSAHTLQNIGHSKNMLQLFPSKQKHPELQTADSVVYDNLTNVSKNRQKQEAKKYVWHSRAEYGEWDQSFPRWLNIKVSWYISPCQVCLWQMEMLLNPLLCSTDSSDQQIRHYSDTIHHRTPAHTAQHLHLPLQVKNLPCPGWKEWENVSVHKCMAGCMSCI